MGRLSDRKRSARRPGVRERARVKNRRYRSSVTYYVAGAGTVTIKLGRKHSRRDFRRRIRLAGEPLYSEKAQGNLGPASGSPPCRAVDGRATGITPICFGHIYPGGRARLAFVGRMEVTWCSVRGFDAWRNGRVYG